MKCCSIPYKIVESITFKDMDIDTLHNGLVAYITHYTFNKKNEPIYSNLIHLCIQTVRIDRELPISYE